MTRKIELPKLTLRQLALLERYARLEASLDDVRRELRDVLEFDFGPENRSIDRRFYLPDPGIIITREHIRNALARKRSGKVEERDLVYWASMLLMNDAYEFDPKDEDLIADWLNDISYNLNPTTEG